MKILISEDDPGSRRMLEASLLSWGYEVIVTQNGAQALALLQGEEPPPLAILDLVMPELNGLEVCRTVRQSQGPTPPYIIILTALGDRGGVVTGIEAGANDYVRKPFDRAELRARVGVGVGWWNCKPPLPNRCGSLPSCH